MDTMGQTGMTTAARLATARSIGVLRVADYDRAKRFYAETLGLEVRDEGHSEGLVMTGVGTAFDIYENPSLPAPENTVLTFVVSDREFGATIQDLRDRGIRFEDYDLPEMGIRTVNGIAETDGNKIAWFKDSEGNILSIATM